MVSGELGHLMVDRWMCKERNEKKTREEFCMTLVIRSDGSSLSRWDRVFTTL